MISFVIINHQGGQAIKVDGPAKDVGDSRVQEIKVIGVKPTPVTAPDGDIELEARCTKPNGETTVVATRKVKVLIPKYQTHTVVPVSIRIENYGAQINSPPATVVSTKLFGTVSIQIYDQFKAPLANIYNGRGAVFELFTAISPPNADVPRGWVALKQLDESLSNLAGGKIDDETAAILRPPTINITPKLSDDELELWKKGKFTIPGMGDNVFQKAGIDPGGFTADQSIRVWGWDVTPSFFRTQKPTQGPYDPTPFILEDKENKP